MTGARSGAWPRAHYPTHDVVLSLLPLSTPRLSDSRLQLPLTMTQALAGAADSDPFADFRRPLPEVDRSNAKKSLFHDTQEGCEEPGSAKAAVDADAMLTSAAPSARSATLSSLETVGGEVPLGEGGEGASRPQDIEHGVARILMTQLDDEEENRGKGGCEGEGRSLGDTLASARDLAVKVCAGQQKDAAMWQRLQRLKMIPTSVGLNLLEHDVDVAGACRVLQSALLCPLPVPL